jgi:hypothetical protein
MLSINLHVKTVHILPMAEHARNSFLVCSVCDEIVSSYAQCAIKSFPRMLSMRMLLFSKITQKSQIKMQISTIRNQNFENRLGSHLIGLSEFFGKKFFGISLQKILVPRLLSHRENVRTSKFWRKSMAKLYQGHIRI